MFHQNAAALEHAKSHDRDLGSEFRRFCNANAVASVLNSAKLFAQIDGRTRPTSSVDCAKRQIGPNMPGWALDDGIGFYAGALP